MPTELMHTTCHHLSAASVSQETACLFVCVFGSSLASPLHGHLPPHGTLMLPQCLFSPSCSLQHRQADIQPLWLFATAMKNVSFFNLEQSRIFWLSVILRTGGCQILRHLIWDMDTRFVRDVKTVGINRKIQSFNPKLLKTFSFLHVPFVVQLCAVYKEPRINITARHDFKSQVKTHN